MDINTLESNHAILKLLSLICLFSLISACSMTPTKSQPVTYSDIGVLIPSNTPNKLCHQYIGLTIFNNEYGEYKLTRDFSELYRDGFKAGVANTSNKYIELGEVSLWDEAIFYKRSEWDHSVEISEDGKKKLLGLIENKNIEYIALPWVDNEEKCELNATTGAIKYSERTSKLSASIQLHLIRVKDFQSVNNRWILDFRSDRKLHVPEDLTTLHLQDIKAYENQFLGEITDDVVALLWGRRSGGLSR